MKRTKNIDVEILKMGTKKHFQTLVNFLLSDFRQTNRKILINMTDGTIRDYNGIPQVSMTGKTIHNPNDYEEKKNEDNDWELLPIINWNHQLDCWQKEMGYKIPINEKDMKLEHQKLWQEKKQEIAEQKARELIEKIKSNQSKST